MKTLSLKFRMETGLPTGSIMKHNFFVDRFTSCKTDIYHHYIIMQAIPTQCRSWLKK